MKPLTLIVIDGWGIGRDDQLNPLAVAKPKTLEFIRDHYASGSLQASGIAVGLPWGEESNSEVGHLTLGAGRVVYQHFLRIMNAIKDGSFGRNKVFLDAVAHVKKTNGAVHLAGLLSDGIVHSSLDHLNALIEVVRANGATAHLHLFADGKDSAPRSLLGLVEKLPAPPASISGRHFAMDRDGYWDRTERAFRAMRGEAPQINDLAAYARSRYAENLTDEFLAPVILNKEGAIQDGDAVIFFNFREDSMRQMVRAFIDPGFHEFPVVPLRDAYVATMTQYAKEFAVPVAFPLEEVAHPLADVFAHNHRSQLRIAETEKYAHVTYFFNCFRDEPYPSEFRVLIPSQRVARHDAAPEMRSAEITDRVVAAIEEGAADFILANFANLDMVAHTGNFDAAIKAIDSVDCALARILETTLRNDCVFLVTSDHGNIEVMRDPKSFMPETKHNQSPVPFHLVGSDWERLVPHKQLKNVGMLGDVAPTILALMKIQKPVEMTGQNFLSFLH